MKFQQNFVIFTIAALCSLISLVASESDKLDCDGGCKDTCDQGIDLNLVFKLLKYLGELLSKKKCERGCDEYPFEYETEIFPAINYDTTTKPEWKSLILGMNKNCCYDLNGIYNNTLSGIKPNGACVILFDGATCTGPSVTIRPDISVECSKWIDCTARVSQQGAQPFNDKTSSLQLC